MDNTLQYFITAFGLVLVIEGAIYALFPGGMKKFLESLYEMTPIMLRSSGLLMAIVGAAIIWAVQNF